jgi:hypothetical protein
MAGSLRGSNGLKIALNVEELADIEADEMVRMKRLLLSKFQTLNYDINSLTSTSALFPALRIYHFSEKELYAHKAFLLYDLEPFSKRSAAIGVVSPRNESRCLIYLWRRLQTQISSLLPSTLTTIQAELQEKMLFLAQYVSQVSNLLSLRPHSDRLYCPSVSQILPKSLRAGWNSPYR